MEKAPEKCQSDKEQRYSGLENGEDEETRCGFWMFKGDKLQRFASKKVYILLFGVVGMIFGSTQSYFYGTVTTLEKSIQISSKNTGIIMAGSDIAFVFASTFLTYIAAKGHRPRWIALGIVAMALSCFVNTLPHIFFGPTKESFSEAGLTKMNETLLTKKQNDKLCVFDRDPPDCSTDLGNLVPQIILFIGSFLSGIGTALYFTLGLSYMDDNVEKKKAPFIQSLTATFRRLGPMVGFSLASLCLKFFVIPDYDPKMNSNDPLWIGAWWLGWIFIGAFLLLLSPLFASFPMMLPRAAERQRETHKQHEEDGSSSFNGFRKTLKRLFTNKTYVFNNSAMIFYMFGYIPFFLFQAKYIEIQYRLTPSEANMVTGSVSLVFSALGVLIAGAVITKIKPTARHLAAWNVFTSALSVVGIIAYSFFGCTALNNSDIVNNSNQVSSCNDNCNCDFVKYSPICGNDGQTYISPCHAGCKQEYKLPNGTTLYSQCSCINDSLFVSSRHFDLNDSALSFVENETYPFPGTALSGVCPVNCMSEFYLFLIVLCINKFVGGTESAANFLIGVRCVEERDKSISLGISMAISVLFSFLPSPIVFGAIIDHSCVLWGSTCSKKGNCWLYNGEKLRYTMNYTAAAFVLVGTCLDMGTWYHSKSFKIFDDKKEHPDEKLGKELVSLTKSYAEEK